MINEAKNNLIDFVIKRIKEKFIDNIIDKKGGYGHNFYSAFSQKFKYLDNVYYAMELFCEYNKDTIGWRLTDFLETLEECKIKNTTPNLLQDRLLRYNLINSINNLS